MPDFNGIGKSGAPLAPYRGMNDTLRTALDAKLTLDTIRNELVRELVRSGIALTGDLAALVAAEQIAYAEFRRTATEQIAYAERAEVVS